MSTIKLNKKIVYRGNITLKTGLHIGSGNTALNIGGPDNFVVRNPLTNIPYIPGSSLKGKMRALVEIKNGETNNGKASHDPNSKAGALFGVAGDSKNARPSRVIVRDAFLATDNDSDDELALYHIKRSELPDFSNTDMPFTESKTEVSIDRITAKSNPRTFERVPAGAIFKIELVVNCFEGENEEGLIKTLKQGLQLLEEDYLGGHGSRGYGQVAIELFDRETKFY